MLGKYRMVLDSYIGDFEELGVSRWVEIICGIGMVDRRDEMFNSGLSLCKHSRTVVSHLLAQKHLELCTARAALTKYL